MKTILMGILNVTPDSFYDGGRYNSLDKAILHAERMITDGADIIDVGGESTRPGAESISLEEELGRVIPVIKELARRFPGISISVDTYKSEVARIAIDNGATIVNDISGLRFDSEMVKVISKNKVSVVIMHMQGTPKTMQLKPYYRDVVTEINAFFTERIRYCLNEGIEQDKIIIDPGIGFGKTTEHNLTILRHLDRFKSLNKPILIGTSRKSFIGRILGTEEAPLVAEERLEGSLATYVWCVIKGAKILRVHDVKEARAVIKLVERLLG